MTTKPIILVPDNAGIHNASDYAARLERGKTSRELSTIMVCPTSGWLPARIVQSLQGLIRPMNQKVIGPLFMEGMEASHAYNEVIKMILENEDMSKFKYILMFEEDMAPPPEGLLKLYESIDDFDVIGGLYWTTGEGGHSMCLGTPNEMPLNFNPQLPATDSVAPCNGLGMGFTLFRTEMFRDPRLEYGQWFKSPTRIGESPDEPAPALDFTFFKHARMLGYKFACDTNVKVGHFDKDTGIMW